MKLQVRANQATTRSSCWQPRWQERGSDAKRSLDSREAATLTGKSQKSVNVGLR